MTHPNVAIAELEQQISAVQWPQLDRRHLTYADIAPVMDELAGHTALQVTHIGASYLGTPIRRLTLGNGPLVVLAWTQMHGDEPTATAAVLDWLQLLLTQQLSGLPNDWQQLLTVHVVPMLNPDGAAQRTRQNAQGIDINRDAMARQSPEGRLLWQQVQSLQPTLAFNLHDQNPYYAVGNSAEPATVAFLAPAYHPDKHVDSARLQAKQMIAHMRQALSHWLPGGIARYDDSYSERSFGDNIAGTGASTILIESGAHRQDPHRQVARRMNVIALQVALEALFTDAHRNYTLADYYAIPANTADGFCDIKICQVTIDDGTHAPFQTDICLSREKGDELLRVEFIGDARGIHGFTEYDARQQQLPELINIGDDATELVASLKPVQAGL